MDEDDLKFKRKIEEEWGYIAPISDQEVMPVA
jgi:hypothetical protein